MSKIIVAMAQTTSVALDLDKTMIRMREYVSQAKDSGADLILFPEAFLGMYPRGATFGTTMGKRTLDGYEQYGAWLRNAISIPGNYIDQISEISREFNIYLVSGVIERSGGTLFCTVVFFDSDGNYLGKHRKIMPTGMERVVWGQGDGSTVSVFDTPIGKMGAAICWENYMPLLRSAYYGEGIELYLAPTLDDREIWIPTMQHIAREGRCYVLSCCQYSEISDLPKGWEVVLGEISGDVVTNGGSCIVAPSGEIVVGPVYGKEKLVVGELDLSIISNWRYDFDPVGHYSRPDIFELIVNKKELKGIKYTS